MRAHTLIVGGGVMGAAIAWRVARRGDPVERPVALLERKHFGAGSSGRSGAILRQFYSDRELVGIARDSLREYAAFEARTGRGVGFTPSGVLSIAHRSVAGTVELVERNVALMRECGCEVELVGARRMRELVGGIAVLDDAVGAWEPSAGFVDPERTVAAFVALARSAGVTAREHSEVRALAIERGRCIGVETTDGVISAEQIVVAAGPWSHALLARAGVELPLKAVRPEQHFVAMPAARERFAGGLSGAPDADADPRFALAREPAPAHPVLLDLELGSYMRCEPAKSRTRVGALNYDLDRELDDPDALDERVSDEFRRWARAQLERRLPRYAEQRDVDAQAAWYTLTPDSQALIGAVPGVENLFVVTGFSGHGFKLAPSIGEGVAQLLCKEPISAFEPAFFSPTRFASRPAAWTGRLGL